MAAHRRLDVKFNRGKNRDVTVAAFVDRNILDEASIGDSAAELFKLVEEPGHVKIVLNFSKVEVMATAVLGTLIKLDKKIKAIGGDLKLCHIRPEIHKVFEITKLDKLFDIHRDEITALVAFDAGPAR